MDLIYNEEQDYLNGCAGNIFVENSRNLLKVKDTVIWALPGGRSVGKIFDFLAQRKDLEWDKIHVFMTDERLVPINDRESNFKLLEERLLQPLLNGGSIKRKNIHPFIYLPEEEDTGIATYEKELVRLGGKYDLLLLSSGEDGHIAGLYPDHDSVKNSSPYFIKIDDSPKPPPMRMSSSRKLLTRSDTSVLLFYGSAKKDALAMFNDGSLTFEQCPAKLVSRIKNSYVLTDQKLKGNQPSGNCDHGRILDK